MNFAYCEDYKIFATPNDNILPYFKKETLNPTWDKKNTIEILSHKLESQLKNPFGNADMKSKISIVNFFFASCRGYCPRMTSQIKKVQSQFRTDKSVQFISYSVTPSIDTTEKLRQYAQENNIAKQNWHLVRGDRDVIYHIAKNQLYSDLEVDLTKSQDQYAHSESLYLIDQNLKLRGIYNSASKRALSELITDIKKLKNEN